MATNAYINKIVIGDRTLLDLTEDTVTPETLYLGVTAHDASGAAIVGTGSGGEGGVTVEALSVTENGTYTAETGHAYNPVTVNVSGGGSNEEKSVKFMDYDGTIVDSYTPSEFALLNELPQNPTHSGLTAQGWNWTLSDAKVHVAKYGSLLIGQSYITDDGKTRLYVTLQNERLSPYLGLRLNGTFEIDWGDGSSSDTITGNTNLVTKKHDYAEPGSYVIKLTPVSGSAKIYMYNNLSTAGSSSALFTRAGIIEGFVSQMYASILTKVELGEDVCLGAGAFKFCRILETITIPENGIDNSENNQYIFNYCQKLKTIVIPKGTTKIGAQAFDGDTCLSNISIPKSVTSIGSYAFRDCKSFTGITLTDSIETIEQYAFYGCVSLVDILIPDTVTAIAIYTFYNCTSLKTCRLPPALTSIGNYVFYCCYALDNVELPETVTTIGQYAFYECQQLSSIDLPEGLSSIGASAFRGCSSLERVVIPNSITKISASTFQNCAHLVDVSIPNTVTTIGTSAFNTCVILPSIDIPASVTSIAKDVFTACRGIKGIHVRATTPPTLGGAINTNIASDRVIYVPAESLEAYKTATNWSTTASKTEAEPE